MKKRILLLILMSQLVAFSSLGQCDCSVKKMINKIDSIAIANDIILGEVIFNKTTTDIGQDWTAKSEFRFDGEFLVLDGIYYNMNKLLYFYIKKDYLGFVFQKI